MIYFLMMMNEETEKQDALYTVIPTTIFKKEIKKYKIVSSHIVKKVVY